MPVQFQNNRSTIVNVNGQFVPATEAQIPVWDRSFLFGDSLYEVVRTYQGKPFRMREHLKRMEKSAALCQMKLTHSLEHYETEILRSIEQYRAQPGKSDEDVYVRLVVSRGAGKIGFGTGNLETPNLYVLYVEPIAMFTPKTFDEGLTLQISKRIRNHPDALDPAMKSGNYLNSLLAYLPAAAAGFDDALMVDYQGFMTEGTTFNIFYVNRGIVATAPLDVGILDGVTRRAIIDLCVKLGIPCRETRFPPQYMLEADEVFFSSSTKEILPVLRIDDKKIGNGKPGPITRQLKEAFDRLVREELKLS